MRYVASVMMSLASVICYAQYDTIYVNEKPVLLIFDDAFDGELGNQDYEVVASSGKGNTLKVKAKAKNVRHTFLQIEVPTVEKQFFFILAYKPEIKRMVYDYRSNQPAVSEPGTEKVKFTTKQNAPGVPAPSVTKSNGAKGKEKQPMEKTDSFYDSLQSLALDDGFEFKTWAVKDSRMVFKLLNVFVYKDYFVFKLLIDNQSSVDYNLAFFDIYRVENKSLVKKNLPDKKRLTILKSYPDPSNYKPVVSGDNQMFIVITNASLSNNNEELVFMVNEENRDRSLFFTYPTRELLKAKRLQK